MIGYLNKSIHGSEGEPRKIKLQVIKKEQLIINTERGGVWYCVGGTVTLFLVVLRQNYEFCLIA